MRKNIPKIKLYVMVDDEDGITIVARNIIECTDCDKQKVFELLSRLNSKSRYGIFEISALSQGTYIQARYEVHHAISNRAGVCMTMIRELSHAVNQFYPEMVSALREE